MFGLTVNNSRHTKDMVSMVAKTFIVGDTLEVKLQDFSKMLSHMGISKLSVFIIDDFENIKTTSIKEPCLVELIEINKKNFKELLNDPNFNFLGYNKESLYILKNSNFKQVKHLFIKINGHNVNIGRGGSQKSHMISPLELRFNAYIFALCNFSYKYMSSLNVFNYLQKHRYLIYCDKLKK